MAARCTKLSYFIQLPRLLGAMRAEAECAWNHHAEGRVPHVGLLARKTTKLLESLTADAECTSLPDKVWEDFKRCWQTVDHPPLFRPGEHSPEERESLAATCPTRSGQWKELEEVPGRIAASHGGGAEHLVALGTWLYRAEAAIHAIDDFDRLRKLDEAIEGLAAELQNCRHSFPVLAGIELPDTEEAANLVPAITDVADEIIRRLDQSANDEHYLGIRLDPGARTVSRDGRAELVAGPLPPLSWALVQELVAGGGQLCSRDRLERVWPKLGLGSPGASKDGQGADRLALATFELRKVLKPLGLTVQGYRNRGWRIDEDHPNGRRRGPKPTPK